jgi:hypothetical protein
MPAEVPIQLATNGGPRQVALRRPSYTPDRVTYLLPGDLVSITVKGSFRVRRNLIVRSWRCRGRVVARVTLPPGQKWWHIPRLETKVYELDVTAGRAKGVLGMVVGENSDDAPYVRC